MTRHSASSRIVAVAACAATAWSCSAGASTVKYHLTLIAVGNVTARAMNNKAVVVGQLSDWQSDSATVFDHRVITPLAPPAGANGTTATCINDAGHVGGSAVFDVDIEAHAVLWQGTTATDLGTRHGRSGESSTAAAVGAHDVVLVVDSLSSDTYVSYLWKKGRITDLPMPEGSVSLRAKGMNSLQHVVGWAYDAGNMPWAFLYRDGQSSIIGDFDAVAVNGVDQVVGSGFANNQQVGVSWTPAGGLEVVGPVGDGYASHATAVNDNGTIVGVYTTTQYHDDSRAWVYQNGVTSDLVSLTDSSGTGWQLDEADAIDAKGVIAGFGYYLGEPALYLATPHTSP